MVHSVENAITALSKGLSKAGTWMNTGEGGLSDYHLKGDGDIIFQIGPGLFGVRDKEGHFNKDMFYNWLIVKIFAHLN